MHEILIDVKEVSGKAVPLSPACRWRRCSRSAMTTYCVTLNIFCRKYLKTS